MIFHLQKKSRYSNSEHDLLKFTFKQKTQVERKFLKVRFLTRLENVYTYSMEFTIKIPEIRLMALQLMVGFRSMFSKPKFTYSYILWSKFLVEYTKFQITPTPPFYQFA